MKVVVPRKKEPLKAPGDSWRQHIARANLMRRALISLVNELDRFADEEANMVQINEGVKQWAESFARRARVKIRSVLNLESKHVTVIDRSDRLT